jgi:hypothetical protein
METKITDQPVDVFNRDKGDAWLAKIVFAWVPTPGHRILLSGVEYLVVESRMMPAGDDRADSIFVRQLPIK